MALAADLANYGSSAQWRGIYYRGDKIGFIGPIMSTVSVATGGKSHEEALGVPMLQGARLAIEEWNAKGGVLGKKIAAVVEDSQCTPDPAVNAANKVIDQDKVKYIVG